MHQNRGVVYDLATGELLPPFSNPPTFNSEATGWDGVFLEQHAVDRAQTGEIASPHHWVMVHLGAPTEVDWTLDGTVVRRRMTDQLVAVIPAGLPFSYVSPTVANCVVVTMEPRFVDGVALDLSGSGWVELQPRVGVADALISGLVMALRSEAEAGAAASRLYGDSLSAALAVHLAKKYSATPGSSEEPRGGLTRQQLRATMDFFHEHLGENVTLERVSQAVGISPFHFARRFRRSTGVPPHRYLVRLRVQRARELLLRGASTLSEVALQVGFYDQSHLATHFKAAFGVTPGRFVAGRKTVGAAKADA